MKKILFFSTLCFLPHLYSHDAVTDALYKLAQALQAEGNKELAYNHYLQTIERSPSHAPALKKLGSLSFEAKKYHQAQEYLEKLIALNPKDEEALIMLGHCALWQKNYGTAINLYSTAISLNSRRIDLYFYRAQSYKKSGNLHSALDDINTFLKHFPSDYAALLLKAYILEQVGIYEEALTILDQLPESPKILAIKAHVYKAMGNTDMAIQLYTKACKEAPDERSYKLGLSYSYLLADERDKGYTLLKEYLIGTHPDKKILDTIEKIKGNRIFISAEIFLDNMVQHMRFAHYIKEHGGITLMQMPESLLELALDCPYIDEVISTTEKIPTYDYYIPAILLPWLFKNYATDTIPYIKAHTTIMHNWQKKLTHTEKKTIGICWHLSETLQSPSENRAIPTEELIPLFNLHDRYNFFAFYAKNQLPSFKELTNYNQLITLCGSGFSEKPCEITQLTAALASCDILVTIDTTIAHIAGALGKTTYLLLPIHSHWRWGSNPTKSAWYPSIQIIRQTEALNWKQPIATLIEKLS